MAAPQCMRFATVFSLMAAAGLFLITPATAKNPNYNLDDDGSAKRKNELSRSNILGLREAFIGRDFVLRINLMGNHLIHDGLVRHALETYQTKAAANAKINYGVLVSPAGEVSTIIGMNFMHNSDVYLHFRTQRGTRGNLIVRAPNKGKASFQKLEDKLVTAQWLEAQLTNQSIQFLKESNGLDANALRATLPRAQSGLQLSSDPNAAASSAADTPRKASMFPAYLNSLTVRAEPSKVRKGETVRLIVEYKLDGSIVGPIEAEESRVLRFQQTRLPGYPVVKTFSRELGTIESVYRQKIPVSAASGTYEFKGEVCVNGECISRIARFIVVD